MTLSEKVSYLKGVAEGLSFDPQQSKEGKLIAIMMDVLEHMALTIEDNDDSIQALADQVDELDDALSGLESAVCDELDLPGEDDADEEDAILGEDEFFELECPHCQDVIVVDQDVLEAGQVTCPNCGQAFSVELTYEDEDASDEEDE